MPDIVSHSWKMHYFPLCTQQKNAHKDILPDQTFLKKQDIQRQRNHQYDHPKVKRVGVPAFAGQVLFER